MKQMARAGLTIDTQTLWDQLAALAHHLTPTHDALHASVLTAPVLGADETRWPLLGQPGATKWHAWALAAPDAVCYRIAGSRSVAAAAAVLRDYQGWLIADGYAVYPALRDQHAAARGPDVSARALLGPRAAEVCRGRAALPGGGRGRAADRRSSTRSRRGAARSPSRRARPNGTAGRQTEGTALVAAIRAWCVAHPVLPESALGKAIRYTLDLWPGLTAFLTEPALPLDTNHVERGMRALAVGRKNHYGSRSERGTRVAALFYSLIESAKLVGLEPGAYLAEATHRAIATPGTVTLPAALRTP